MAYTTINKSTDYFNTLLYTGTGSTNAVTGVGFQPDMVWIKNRSTTFNHQINDAVRGVNKQIAPNLSNAQETNTGELTAFGSDGFTVGSGGTLNGNGNNIVAWNWKANGAGSSNSDGSITSTVSVNTTSGFSIVKYAGTGASATVGHGLGVTPGMIICKNLSASEDWVIWINAFAANQYIRLNTNAAVATSTGMWNNTLPTSSVFSVNNEEKNNNSGQNIIAYCFAEKTGFSKFGSYTGTGDANLGPFIYTGFKPAFIWVKVNASADSSKIWDNKRPGYNLVDNWLEADDNQAEGSGSNQIDILSNGFKIRNANTAGNKNNTEIYYMAFAEAPLVGSNNIPATAR